MRGEVLRAVLRREEGRPGHDARAFDVRRLHARLQTLGDVALEGLLAEEAPDLPPPETVLFFSCPGVPDIHLCRFEDFVLSVSVCDHPL